MQNTPKTDREPIPVTLDSLAELGQVWTKPCNFDHAHVAVTAHAILVTDETGATWKRTLTTYNGTATLKSLNRFTELPGRRLDDPAKEIAQLMKQGFTLATPEPPAPEPKKAQRVRKGVTK